jgi:hypothetical protein
MAGVGGSSTTILNQIEMATVPSQQGLNQNLLSKTSPLLRVLQENAKRETGSPIRAHVRYNRNNSQWYYGGEDLAARRTQGNSDGASDTGSEQFAQAEYNWKDLSVNVMITESMLVENAGLNINDLLNINDIGGIPERDRNTVFNIFGREVEMAGDDMSDALATALTSNDGAPGTGTHDDTSASHSVFTLLDNGSFGGLAANLLGTFSDLGLLASYNNTYDDSGNNNVASTNKWQSKSINVGQSYITDSVEGVLSKELLGLALHDCSQGGTDSVDYIFVNPRVYVGLEMLLEGQTRRDETMSNIGFTQNMSWNAFGTTIMADPFIGVSDVIGINSKHTYMAIHPALDQQFSGFKTRADRATIEGQLKIKTQLVTDDRAKNFWIDLGGGDIYVGGSQV